MNPLVAVALCAWIPLGILSFATGRPARSILFLYVAGWLFLPIAVLDAPFVDLSKDVSIAVACTVGALVFAPRPRGAPALALVDVPMLAWCAAPFASSLANGLGVYDACSGSVARFLTWGAPYFLGRYYLASERGALALCKAIFVGAIVYVPLCWIELRFSPQLHAWVYGYHQHEFAQTIRDGGFRPQVFMNHGLMLGLWMCAAGLVGLALWRERVVARLLGAPIGAWAVLVAATAVLCRSMGALILFVAGASAYAVSRRCPRLGLQLLALLPLGYVALRAPGAWSGEDVVDCVRSVSADRALSLQFRLDAEGRLLEHALEQPAFGWGGFSRAFVPVSEDDDSLVISDSQWIIAFGQNGAFGLCALLLVGAVPIWTWLARERRWRSDRRAHAVGWTLALVLALYMVDNLVNAMTNPVYMLAAGTLAGWKPALAHATASVRDCSRTGAQAGSLRADRARRGSVRERATRPVSAPELDRVRALPNIALQDGA